MNPKEFEMIQNMKEAQRIVSEHWQLFASFERLKAKAKREFYLECLEQGFAPEEALRLTAEHRTFAG